ncbi:mitochondrial carrier domain-containing protein [Crepidotus variabilis]|uniref:Mitochondrial carrier domain-containing protein n=1 Tax=Crepidotus variabilis TaxID=179855 RepID=A0A9P6EN88_9AGAR|nr:mitochondrial carrier domain-containing protein [Crepidotus variabilis]
MEPFQAKIVAAATGSTLTALTMTPFDVVKTRLQTQPPEPRLLFPKPPLNTCCQPTGTIGCVRNMSSLAARSLPAEIVCVWEAGMWKAERVNGPFDAARKVWMAEGARGLWKGVGTTLVIGVPSSTAYILTYDHLLRQVLPSIMSSPTFTPLVAGVAARSAITTLVSPLELIRTNLQSTPLSPGTPHTLRSVLTSIRTLTQTRGVFAMWRGLGATLWRDSTFSGFYWASYEAWKRNFQRRGHDGTWVTFVSGAISGTSAALLTSPFDVLKTRRQALIMSSTNYEMTRTLSLFLQVIRTEGPSALFAGLTPRIIKIAPACGIMISCFEGIGKLLSKPSSS